MAVVRTPIEFRSTRLACAMLAAGMTLLTACGGGGGSEKDPQADPQNVPSGTFATIETGSRNASGVITNEVQVVDITQGKIVAKYDVTPAISSDYPSKTWVPTYQVAASSDGLSYQQQGLSQLVLLQSGKLMIQDLSGKAMGVFTQMSNATDVCTVLRDTTYLQTDGRHVWLRITTKGADNSCTNTADNVEKLVATDMSATDAPVLAGPGGMQIVGPLYDIKGVAQALLVYDRSKLRLATYTTDLKTLINVVSLGGQPLAGGEAARIIVRSPARFNEGLMQVGSYLYRIIWNGSSVTVSAPLLTNLIRSAANTSPPVVATASDRYYVGNGATGYAFNAAGTLLNTLPFPAERGDITEVAVTTLGVVVNQTITSSSSGTSPGTGSSSTSTSSPTAAGMGQMQAQAVAASVPPSTLWSVNGTTGSLDQLAASVGTAPLSFLAVQGNTVVYSEAAGAGQSWNTIYRADAASLTKTIAASDVAQVDRVTNPQSGGYERVDQFIWCTPTSLTGTSTFVGCANGSVTAYNIATGALTPMGSITTAAGSDTTASVLFGVRETWSGRNSLIELRRKAGLPASYSISSEVWMLNPGKANSMQRLTPLP